jgi:hypothetical protein
MGMAVEINECNGCHTPSKQVFCGHVVIEDELCLVPGISRPDKVKIEPLFNTFKVEFVCFDLVVVCGIIRKKIYLGCYSQQPIIHEFAFQASIPVNIESSVPIKPYDVTVTGVEVCDGCYKLLSPTVVDCKTIYHKIKEKDVLAIEVTYAAPCLPPHHRKDYDKDDEE